MTIDASAATLRPARVADADDVGRVYRISRQVAMPWLASEPTAEETLTRVRTVLIPSGGVTVAEVGGEVVAYCWAGDGWLFGLFVDPAFQGEGVGSALFESVQRQLPDGFELWVYRRNSRALQFYEGYGCREFRRTDGTSDDPEPGVLLRWEPAST